MFDIPTLLKVAGLSEYEYHLLVALWEAPRCADELIVSLVSMYGNAPATYLEAIRTATERQLIQEINQEVIDQRIVSFGVHEPFNDEEHVTGELGQLDYTNVGYRLHRLIEHNLGIQRSSEIFKPEELTVQILAESEVACERRAFQLAQHPPFGSSAGGERARLVSIEGPEVITGVWRLSRFETVQYGFKVKLTYS